jgi:hypothetical protein
MHITSILLSITDNFIKFNKIAPNYAFKKCYQSIYKIILGDLIIGLFKLFVHSGAPALAQYASLHGTENQDRERSAHHY